MTNLQMTVKADLVCSKKLSSTPPLRVFSFGGGVQSMAALVLAAQGEIAYDAFVFSNVGEDSENPETLTYFRDVALPFAANHNIRLEEIRKQRRGGGDDTLLDNVMRVERSIPIPVRVQNGMPGRRNCTTTFKIRVIAKWLKVHGATDANPAVLGLGISMDEFQRMRTNSGFSHYTLEYPLIDRRLNREQCVSLIADAELPIPPKSACWFCPFHKLDDWRDLKRNQPELFERSVVLERVLNERRQRIGRDGIFFSSRRKPLDEAIDDKAQDDDHSCDSGYCFL